MSGYEKAIGALSIGNTVWLAVLTLYQYRTNTSLKSSLVEQEKVLKQQQRQIRELQDIMKNHEPFKKAIEELDENITDVEKKHSKKIKKTKETLHLHDEQMMIIMNELKSQGYDIENILEGDFSSLPAATSSSSKSRSRNVSKKSSKESNKTISTPSTSRNIKRPTKSSRPNTPAKSKIPEPQTETESDFDPVAFAKAVEKNRR